METNCTRRSRSTVSTQALTLLNSDDAVAWARAFADRALQEAPDAPIRFAVLAALSRTAPEDELSLLHEFAATQQAGYLSRGDTPDAAKRNSIIDVCHMLLAANEFVYVD
jgi:hypothetical protein